MRYFKQVNPKVIFYGSIGQPIRFPDFGNGFGGIATEDPALIKELELTMKKSVGGVSEITAQELEDLKKKAPLPKSSRPQSYPANLRSIVRQHANIAAPRRGAADAERNLALPGEENLLLPSEPAKPSRFRPKSIPAR